MGAVKNAVIAFEGEHGRLPQDEAKCGAFLDRHPELCARATYESPRWSFRDKRTGRFTACRVESFADDDPRNAYVGGDVIGEVVNDLRKRDVRHGCTKCREPVVANASEPDVMRQWGFR